MSARIVLRSTVLAVWGAVFLYFWLMGRLPVYIAAGFRPLVPIAAFAMLALAVLLLLAPLKERLGGQALTGSRARNRNDTLGRRVLETLQYLLLFVPIIASAIAAPQSYSATTVMNRLGEVAAFLNADEAPAPPQELDGSMQEEVFAFPSEGDPAALAAGDLDASLPLPGEEPAGQVDMDPSAFDPTPYINRDDQGRIVAELTDLWNAAADPAFRKVFEDSEVSLKAQLLVPKRLRERGLDAGQPAIFKVARLMIFCCASDAQPVAMQVQHPSVPQGKDMDWVQLDGRVDFRAQGGEIVPYFLAENVTPSEAPPEIYLTY